MPIHRDLTGAQIHRPYTWEYSTESARTAATGFTATDVGKFARQLSDNTIWMLSNHDAITWSQVGGASGASGDMSASTYDPTSVGADAFDSVNHAYSNTTSGLTASNVQAAIDEVAGETATHESNFDHTELHEHTNAVQLAKITEDAGGDPLWDGSPWPGGDGTGTSFAIVSKSSADSPYTASAEQYVAYDTSGGASTVTLPASPTAGDRVAIADRGGSFATNNLTVSGTINGETDYVLKTKDAVAIFRYLNATEGWKLEYMGPESMGGTATKTLVFTTSAATYSLSTNAPAGGLVTFTATTDQETTLPAAASSTGVRYNLKKKGASGTLTITPDGTDTIDGESSLIVTTQYFTFTLVSDGTEWCVI